MPIIGRPIIGHFLIGASLVSNCSTELLFCCGACHRCISTDVLPAIWRYMCCPTVGAVVRIAFTWCYSYGKTIAVRITSRWRLKGPAMGKMRNCRMRNAESKMWNQKCGITLIGRGDKPRDRWLSADYHTSLSTDSAVKCRPEVRKSLAMEADSVSWPWLHFVP